MKINLIQVSGFKNCHDEMVPRQHNVFIGPNGSGKSGRALAPMLAIMGRTPKGDTMETTAEFASHDGCFVGLGFDDGFRFTRTLLRDPRNNSNSMKLDIKGEEKLGLRESERIVADRVGKFAPMFNTEEFLSKSAEARRNFVLGLCTGGEFVFDKKYLQDRISLEFCKVQLGDNAVNLAFFQGKPSDSVAAFGKLYDAMPPGVYDAFESSSANIATELKDDLIKSIAGALGQAKKQRDASKLASAQSEAAAESLTAQQKKLATIAESVGQLTDKRKELVFRKEAAIKKHGESEGVQGSIAAHERAAALIKTKIDAIIVSLHSMTPCNADEIKSKIDANQKHIEELDLVAEPSMDTVEALKMELESVTVKDLEAKDATRAKVNVIKDEEASRTRMEKYRAELEDDDWKKVIDLISLIKPMLDHEIIKTQEWTDLIGITHGHHNEDDLNAVHAEWTGSTETLQKYDRELEALKTAQSKLADQRLIKQRDYDKARVDYNDAKARHVWSTSEITRLSNENSKLTKTIDDHTSSVEKHHENEKNLRQRLADHEQEIQRIKDEHRVIDLVVSQAGINTLKADIEAVEKRIEDKQEEAGLAKRIKECIVKSKEQQVLHEVCKKQVKAIQNVRENYMQELIAPLIKYMDRFLYHATIERRAYCDLVNANGKAIFELGWIINDKDRISLNALSGGEATTFCAALAYALVELANPPVKLLILELAETDVITFNNLLDAIVEVCGEDIQSFIATHSMESIVDSNWNVVQCVARPDHVIVNREENGPEKTKGGAS